MSRGSRENRTCQVEVVGEDFPQFRISQEKGRGRFQGERYSQVEWPGKVGHERESSEACLVHRVRRGPGEGNLESWAEARAQEED